jgi:hypothetical protein
MLGQAHSYHMRQAQWCKKTAQVFFVPFFSFLSIGAIGASAQ